MLPKQRDRSGTRKLHTSDENKCIGWRRSGCASVVAVHACSDAH